MSVGIFDDWIEIFRTGNHTSSGGTQRTWRERDLDEIIHNYNPKISEAPLVIGHPKTSDPAYGWVEGLKRIGPVLMAKFKQVDPGFAEKVKNGRYKKKSISVLPGNRLNHVGFLGAAQPAVEGLADFSTEAFKFEWSADKEDAYPSGPDNELSYSDMRDMLNYC